MPTDHHPLSGMRIGLLTAHASRLGGGVFEAVVAHAELLRELGARPHVFALADRHDREDAARFACPVTHVPMRGPAQVGFAPGMVDALLAADLDLLHLHGIWMYPSAAGAAWAAETRKPYVISPHGMLDPWITARGRWKKALARAGYERRSWHRAGAFHALTGREAADIAREAQWARSEVIPNSAPPIGGPKAPPAPNFTYIGRIHPKKNLGALIDAWSELAGDGGLPPAARLVLAGWGEDAHVAEMQQRLETAHNSISFVGPVYGDAKAALLGEARFAVLPSLSEGLPMAVLEAWSARTPTLMSAACNLPSGFENGAAIDCGFAAKSIRQSLEQAMGMDDAAWQVMSDAARALAEGPFGAETVAAEWATFYAGLAADRSLAR